MPEVIYWEPAMACRRFMVFPVDHFKPRCHSDQVDYQVERQIGGPDQKSLFEGVLRQVGKLIRTVDRLFDALRAAELFGGSLHK